MDTIAVVGRDEGEDTCLLSLELGLRPGLDGGLVGSGDKSFPDHVG
jgi:hypothetical protein